MNDNLPLSFTVLLASFFALSAGSRDLSKPIGFSAGLALASKHGLEHTRMPVDHAIEGICK